MRLCDATIGFIEDRVEATSLVPNGTDYEPTEEEWEAYLEYLEEDASLAAREREMAGWVDADLVTSDDVRDVAA